MVQPSDYAAVIARERQWWSRAAAELMELPDYAQAMDAQRFEEQLSLWCDQLPERISPLPLREGHQVHLGGKLWQVLQTPGPWPGHMSLFCAEDRWLFSGRLATERAFGDLQVRQIRPMLQSIERTFDLRPSWSLPTLGPPRADGLQHLRRANKRLVSLLNHLPFVLQGSLTLPSVVRRDLGYVPSHMARFLASVRFYQSCFDELVRAGGTRRKGQGLHALYGAGAPDPRLAPG
jgi:glyoxylase-like metal-dependent hydrolase (beta-lactamase superfamily II)